MSELSVFRSIPRKYHNIHHLANEWKKSPFPRSEDTTLFIVYLTMCAESYDLKKERRHLVFYRNFLLHELLNQRQYHYILKVLNIAINSKNFSEGGLRRSVLEVLNVDLLKSDVCGMLDEIDVDSEIFQDNAFYNRFLGKVFQELVGAKVSIEDILDSNRKINRPEVKKRLDGQRGRFIPLSMEITTVRNIHGFKIGDLMVECLVHVYDEQGTYDVFHVPIVKLEEYT